MGILSRRRYEKIKAELLAPPPVIWQHIISVGPAADNATPVHSDIAGLFADTRIRKKYQIIDKPSVFQLDGQCKRAGTANIHLYRCISRDYSAENFEYVHKNIVLPIESVIIQKESEYCIRYYLIYLGKESFNTRTNFMNKFEEFAKESSVYSSDNKIRVKMRTSKSTLEYIDSGDLLFSVQNIDFDTHIYSNCPPGMLVFTGIRPDNISNVFDDGGNWKGDKVYVNRKGVAEVSERYNAKQVSIDELNNIKKIYGNEKIKELIKDYDPKKREQEKVFFHLAGVKMERSMKNPERYYTNEFDNKHLCESGVAALDAAIEELPENDRKIINKRLINIIPGDSIQDSRINNNTSLQAIIGMDAVKEEIKKMESKIIYNKVKKEAGYTSTDSSTMHMCFMGNPGTGKTTIARYITTKLYAMNYIKYNECIEVNAQHMKGAYSGQTATVVRTILKAARGRVLFIDEAYALCDDYQNGYGQEAISVLIKEMEDNRDDLVIIFAGYKKEMEHFLAVNDGLKSRINKYIDFPNYTPLEAIGIMGKFMHELQLDITDEALVRSYKLFESAAASPQFSNARFVRNYLDKIRSEHAYRCRKKMPQGLTKEERNLFLYTITIDDITPKICEELLGMSH